MLGEDFSAEPVLIWQITTSEFYFSEVNWQAFRKIDFLRAVRSSSAAVEAGGASSLGALRDEPASAEPLRGPPGVFGEAQGVELRAIGRSRFPDLARAPIGLPEAGRAAARQPWVALRCDCLFEIDIKGNTLNNLGCGMFPSCPINW
jgi:hypothetical protein